MLSRTKITYRLINRLSSTIQNIQLYKRKILKKTNLSNASTACIDLLLVSGPQSSGDIAKYIGLTSGATTLLITKLEEEGFLRRKIDAKDRRKVIVHPIMKKLKQHHNELYTLEQRLITSLDGYSLEEIAIISDFLERTADIYEL